MYIYEQAGVQGVPSRMVYVTRRLPLVMAMIVPHTPPRSVYDTEKHEHRTVLFCYSRECARTTKGSQSDGLPAPFASARDENLSVLIVCQEKPFWRWRWDWALPRNCCSRALVRGPALDGH